MPSHPTTIAQIARAWPLALALGGCSIFRSVEGFGLRHADSFSADALARGGVVVAAVVSAEPAQLARESSPAALASGLRTRLLAERPAMTVLLPESVEQALGVEGYRAFATFLRRTGETRTEYLPEIHRHLQGAARYLLVAVIESDVAEIVSQEPARTTTMFFALQDLETEAIEWQGHYQGRPWSRASVGTIEAQAEMIYGAFLEALFTGEGDDR